MKLRMLLLLLLLLLGVAHVGAVTPEPAAEELEEDVQEEEESDGGEVRDRGRRVGPPTRGLYPLEVLDEGHRNRQLWFWWQVLAEERLEEAAELNDPLVAASDLCWVLPACS